MPKLNGSGATCSCGRRGRYTGCQPQGGNVMRVAFDCVCGEVWGFNVMKTEIERYRS